MTSVEETNWNVGQKSGLIFIGTRKLFLQVTGPDRTRPEQPVLILLPGVTNTIKGWAAIQRLTSPFARLVAYDRSGLGSSESSPNGTTTSATAIAQELDSLLRAAHIDPPYITIGHSWGGILALEFLALRPLDDIAGMVFVDATQGKYLERIPFLDPAIGAVNQGVDWFGAIGLREESVLTAEEYAAFLEAEMDPRTAAQRGGEFVALMESYAVAKERGFLGRRPPVLGQRPVCVIKGRNVRDLERAYRAGVAMGNGTVGERERYLELLGTWDEKEMELQRELLTLSDKGHFLVARKGGHNVHMVDPETVVEGIKWTLANLGT